MDIKRLDYEEYKGRKYQVPDLNKDEFPCLTYTRDPEDWHDFIRRSPEEQET